VEDSRYSATIHSMRPRSGHVAQTSLTLHRISLEGSVSLKQNGELSGLNALPHPLRNRQNKGKGESRRRFLKSRRPFVSGPENVKEDPGL
jgi:hypothetical protein